MKTIFKSTTSVFILLILVINHCCGQNKYFRPTDITDITDKLVAGEVHWTPLKNKERIDGYTRINNAIYGGEIDCNISPLKDVDANSFEAFPGSFYGIDKNRVYYPIMKNCVDYEDCGVCYYKDYVVEGANPKSFKYLGKDYAVDGSKVYYRGKILEGADGATFMVVQGPKYFYVGKDKLNVYIHNKIFNEADPQTFHIDLNNKLNEPDSDKYVIGDKNHKWFFTPPHEVKSIESE